MNPKCNLSPEERREIFGEFTGHLDIEQENEIKDLFPQYLFFRSVYEDNGWTTGGTPFRLCTCSACGYEFEGVRINGAYGRVHNERVTCPSCGRTLTGKAVYKYKYDMHTLQSWIKTAVAWTDSTGGLLIEAADCSIDYTHDDLTGILSWYPKARYYFAAGKLQKWEQIITEWDCDPDRVRLSWQATETVGDPFRPNGMGWNPYYGDYQIIGLWDALKKSGLKYCEMENFYCFTYGIDTESHQTARWWVKYLAYAAQYPQIEMAVKWNLREAVHELIADNKKNGRILNWSGSNPSEFLRMSKQDAKTFLKSGMDFEELKLWKQMCPKSPLKDFREIENAFEKPGLDKLAACAKESNEPFMTCARYVLSLLPKCPQNATASPSAIAGIWKDYLHMAKQLGYDLTEKTVLMPKNLQERHDIAAGMIKHIEAQDEKERYEKRFKALCRRFGYSFGDLVIIVPNGSSEIVAEGKTLHHCVGGYAQRHIEGKTTILFLRHKKRPGRSFLTIELDESKRQVQIRQIHGYKNERYEAGRYGTSPMTKYAWFLTPWLEWINTGSRRDKAGNPIINEEVKTA